MSFQPKDTLILTPKGKVSIADLKEGDTVSTPTGVATIVATAKKETTRQTVEEPVVEEAPVEASEGEEKPRKKPRRSKKPQVKVDNVNIYKVTLDGGASFQCGEAQAVRFLNGAWEIDSFDKVLTLYKDKKSIILPLYYNRPDLNKKAIVDIQGITEEGTAYSIELDDKDGLYIQDGYVILADARDR